MSIGRKVRSGNIEISVTLEPETIEELEMLMIDEHERSHASIIARSIHGRYSKMKQPKKEEAKVKYLKRQENAKG